MKTMEMCYAALFSKAPKIGETNPDGEINYLGYARVPFVAESGENIETILFPKSEQDEPVFATHVVAFNAAGEVVGVKAL